MPAGRKAKVPKSTLLLTQPVKLPRCQNPAKEVVEPAQVGMDRFFTTPTANAKQSPPEEAQSKRRGRPRQDSQTPSDAKPAKLPRCQESADEVVKPATEVVEPATEGAEDEVNFGYDEHAEHYADRQVDQASLVEIARCTWAAINGEDATDSTDFECLGGLSSDKVLAWPALPDGRMPFQLLAAVLELGHENATRFLRALTHVFSWALKMSSDPIGDFDAVLFTLVAPSRPHPQIAHVIGEVFKKKIDDGHGSLGALTAYSAPRVRFWDLPTIGLEGRRTQRTLFSERRLGLAEVADAKVPIPPEVAALQPSHGWPWLQKLLKPLFGKASVNHREIFHMVRVLQRQGCPAPSTVLRAAAYALQRAAHEHEDNIKPEVMAQFDADLFRAWAERGAEPRWLAKLTIPLQKSPASAAPFFAESAARAMCGVRVRPMKAEEAASISDALSKLEDVGAIWCERLSDGRRGQVHLHRDGSPLQLFAAPGPCTAQFPEGELTPDWIWPGAVAAIMEGGLRNAGDAILEVMLMTDKEARASNSQVALSTVQSVVVFDVLVLDGETLTRLPLRERRKRLESVVVETPRFRLAPGVEIAPDADRLEIVKKELVGHCSASITTKDPDEKVCSRAFGVMLKVLDEIRAEYVPGVCTPHWQAITQRPAIEGPEAERRLFENLSDEERSKLVDAEAFHFCVVSARRTQTKEGRDDIMAVQRQFREAGVSPRWYVDGPSLEDYRGLGLDAIEGGKLIPARNMALDDAQKLGKICVQASDDIEKWQYIAEQGGWTKKNSQAEANAVGRTVLRYTVSPVAAARFILAKMRAAESPKPQLGGVLPHHNPGLSIGLPQTSAKCFILGDFFVVDKSACRFDTRMTLKEDYDLTAAHMKEHGAVLRCNHMMVFAKHETNAGGACSIRDDQGERERENIRILQDKYPGGFRLNPHRPNQVVFNWRGHLKWMREQQGLKAD